jgi:branched-subunit amino acid ABC-type transport system permease component
MHSLVLDIAGTLSAAANLFVVAAGLTLVFGAMRIINMAHGSFYMYGAFAVTTVLGVGAGWRFWLALLAGAVVAAVAGLTVEVTVIRRLYDAEHLTQLLATYAVLLIFADIGQRIWGTGYRTVNPPPVLASGISIAGGQVPRYQLFVIGVGAAVGLALWLMLARTRFGWLLRAAVQDPESVATGGTNLAWLRTGVFVIGAFLAGLGGALIAPMQSIAPGMDVSIIVSVFIVVTIGGLGSVAGAALGALLIGLAQTLGAEFFASWAASLIYLTMIVVLAIRPWGLLGVPER